MSRILHRRRFWLCWVGVLCLLSVYLDTRVDIGEKGREVVPWWPW